VPMHKARTFPIAFGPLNFYVNRRLLQDERRRLGTADAPLLNFPGCNIAAQVENAVVKARGRNNTVRGTVNADYVDFHEAIGNTTYGGMSFAGTADTAADDAHIDVE